MAASSDDFAELSAHYLAWKAQQRLSKRYRTLTAKGKKSTVAITAVARELAGFLWAVGREMAATVAGEQSIRTVA